MSIPVSYYRRAGTASLLLLVGIIYFYSKPYPPPPIAAKPLRRVLFLTRSVNLLFRLPTSTRRLYLRTTIGAVSSVPQPTKPVSTDTKNAGNAACLLAVLAEGGLVKKQSTEAYLPCTLFIPPRKRYGTQRYDLPRHRANKRTTLSFAHLEENYGIATHNAKFRSPRGKLRSCVRACVRYQYYIN